MTEIRPVIPVGNHLHAVYQATAKIGPPHEIYKIRSNLEDLMVIGYVEWYPHWYGYTFMPRRGVVLPQDYCAGLGRLLEDLNKREKR